MPGTISVRKTKVLILSILGIAAGLLLLAAIMPARQPDVSVSFAGYTNSPTAGRLAAFEIRNQGTTQVWRLGLYYIEARDKTGPARPPRLFGSDTLIAPHQSSVYTVPAYTNRTGWRVMLYFSKNGPGLALQRWVSGWPADLARLVPRSLKNVSSWVVASDWVEN